MRDANKIQSSYPMLILHWGVLEKVVKTIGAIPAESGGAIGGDGGTVEVSCYHFDESSRSSSVTYSPDYKLLNRLFKTEWNPQGIRLRGFIHSHPGHLSRPSCGDEVYAERILQTIEDLDCLWLPIVNTIPDTGQFRLTAWAAFRAERGVSIVRGKVKVVNAPERSFLEVNGEAVLEAVKPGNLIDEIIVGKAPRVHIAITSFWGKKKNRVNITESQILGGIQEISPFNIDDTFVRVQDAYDLELMHNSRVIAVGAGGAADWLEHLARAGLGQFVIIDPDVVSETNLATQQTYRRDIGRPKVDCISERIRDINPTARPIALQKSLDDLTDEEIRRLAFDPIDGRETRRTVICGLTDDFFAQARVNRIALHFGLPSLCAQVYKEGRGAEITFTYPGITPACHRCILSSRYRYFLEQRKKNNVTSHGTPIFATARLNAIKGFLTLALLHHGSNHPRWGNMLARIGKRNLIQIRMDPDFAETLGIGVFDRIFEKADNDRIFFDETLWLPQEQECPDTGYPVCPDCGGTGDLRDAIGKFYDTRLMVESKVSRMRSVPVFGVNARCVIKTYERNGGKRETVFHK